MAFVFKREGRSEHVWVCCVEKVAHDPAGRVVASIAILAQAIDSRMSSTFRRCQLTVARMMLGTNWNVKRRAVRRPGSYQALRGPSN